MIACDACGGNAETSHWGSCATCNGTGMLTCFCGDCCEGGAIGVSALTGEFTERVCRNARAATPNELNEWHETVMAAERGATTHADAA